MDRFSQLGRLVCVALGLVIPAAPCSAQDEVLYLACPGFARLQAYQHGNLLFEVNTHYTGATLAVRDTIWIGDTDNGGGPGTNFSFEYGLDGVPTGNRRWLENIDRGEFLDGAAVDSNTNYTLDASFFPPNEVYRTDAQWGHPVHAFTVSGGTDYAGITFDPTTGTLFVSDRSHVYQYTVTGSLLSQFPHAGGRGCLAYESATDTLWYVPNLPTAPLLQYSKSGNLLQTVPTPLRCINIWGAAFQLSSVPLGDSYCSPAAANSTGSSGTLTAIGSAQISSNDVTLTAASLPTSGFGYFLAGQTQGLFNPPGSQGTLCLMSNIGRYDSVTDIIQGPAGSLALDLTSIPVNPPTAVVPGDTWNFQCWYRDSNPAPTSNFTDGVSITFQ